MSATHRLLRFGLFELNLDTEELRKDGIPLKLGPQPFKVVAILASRSGQIVTRDEIRQEVWGEETYVDFEHGLNQCIKQIRTALNDDSSKPLYIETLPRKGYRFLAPVTSKTIATSPKVTPSSSGVQPRVTLPPVSPAQIAPAAASTLSREAQPVAPAAISPDSDVLHDSQLTEEAATAGRIAPQPARHGMVGRVLRWAAVPVLAMIGIAFYWHSQNANALMEKDTVVVGDFANSTGEAVFDDTLKQALRIQLEQSPFLNLVPDQKVNATLRLTGRAAGDRLTPDVTRDICQRVGSKAMFNGSIAQLGSQYVVGVQAVNCSTGEVMVEALEQAKNKEDVLKALDRTTLEVRRKLGESLRTVQNFATPVEEATTTSLEALKAYSLGLKTQMLTGDTAALPFYKRAIELDPNFAMAYRALSIAYTNLSEGGLAAKAEQRAYDLREKVTERERHIIEAHYYTAVTGELEKAIQKEEWAKETYPRDPKFYRHLVLLYSRLGNYEKAATEAVETLRLDPNNYINYSNLGADYQNLDRLDDAESIYKQAAERNLDGEWLLGNRYNMAFLRGNSAEMEKLVAAAKGRPGVEDVLLVAHSDTEAWYGKLQSARELTRHAMDLALRNDAKETAASYQAAAALRDVESGDRERARDQANAALTLGENRDVKALSALTLAKTGDVAQAEKLVAELNDSFPLDTLIQKYWVPSIRAAVALQHGQPDQAVELLKVTAPYQFASPANVNAIMIPAYLRGQSYLMLRQGAPARAEFEKFVQHRGLAANFQWAALARLGIARAYALDAQTDSAAREKARAAYQEFLTLWKDADPDVPIYQQAKAEYARLTAVGP